MSRRPSPALVSGERGPTLTRRASLNSLAALVDYATRIVVFMVLAPLLLRFLGDAGYGAWQVLQRLIGQAAPAGGRPGEALKWVVAQGQSSDDRLRKRQQVGTAIAVWALFLPLVATFGGVLTWVSPWLVDASPDQVAVVRAAAGLLVLNLMLIGLASVPQAVLLGENLGYRRLGYTTAILVVGGLLTALALWAGWGLRGVALATIVTTLLSGITYLRIVRSQVPWFGAVRPPRGAVKGFVGLSWWFLLWNLVMQAIKGSDVIVLGVVGGTVLVTTYTLTSYVPHAIGDIVFVLISATMPGLGGLVGAGELDRAAKVRGETMVLAWLVALAAGATAIVWLPSFLDLWVGSRYDAGTTATVLICIMMVQLVLFRVDSNVIDLTLRIRAKVLLGLFSTVLSVGLALLLVGPGGLGITGLVAGFILGRLPLSMAYPVLVSRLLQRRRAFSISALWRPALTSAVLIWGATWLRSTVGDVGWMSLIALGAASGVTLFVAAYLGGLSQDQRRKVRHRLRKVVHLS